MLKVIAKRNPNMMFVISLVVIAIVNTAVIALANMFFPDNVVLGTMSLSSTEALLLSSAAISVLTCMAIPFVFEAGHKLGRDITPMEMMISYFFINTIVVWLIARESEIFGMGISSWLIVLILAFVLNFFQGMAMMWVEKLRTE